MDGQCEKLSVSFNHSESSQFQDNRGDEIYPVSVGKIEYVSGFPVI